MRPSCSSRGSRKNKFTMPCASQPSSTGSQWLWTARVCFMTTAPP